MALYNLESDHKERKDVSKEYPEIVRKILAIAEEARTDLGDLGREGENTRAAGMIDRIPICNKLDQ